MKTLIIISLIFIVNGAYSQKGFENYPDLIIHIYDAPYHSLIDDSYTFSTENLTRENTQIILDEISRILALNGQDLSMTVRTIPDGITYKDVYEPKQTMCLHYKIGDMMIYFGTWDDEDGTHVGFTATTHIEE